MRIVMARHDPQARALQDYLALKYRIFVVEQGWSLPSDVQRERVLEDRYDAVSEHYAAYDDSGVPLGTVRVTSLARGFPYREYFTRHLGPSALDPVPSKSCCFTSMAVIPDYRGRAVSFRGQMITVAKGLLWYVVDELRGAGIELCLLTATKGASAACFRHCGWYLLDGPFFSERFGTDLFNLALLVNDRRRFEEVGSPFRLTCNAGTLGEAQLRIKAYLTKRHAEVLRTAPSRTSAPHSHAPATGQVFPRR
jgi:N-acyl-L-homoserine lactone synthetase